MHRDDHGGDIYSNTNVKLDFSVNINPLGLPDNVRTTLMSRIDEFTHYPDPHCRELRNAISHYENVPFDWLLCGNGAADLIYRICYALRPKKALVPVPTFSEYERALKQVGCQVTHHCLTSNNEFALTEEILEKITRDIDILFLCNPNNPTGRLISSDLLNRILTKANENGTIVVIDECFLDFSKGISAKHTLADMANLVILKAFTKMYAMAGLRLGYLLTANKTLLDAINYAAQCWSVSVPAQIAGTIALSLTNWQERTRQQTEEERHFLSEELQKLGITVFDSDANFILFRSKKPLFKPLLQQGIMIRPCENFFGLDNTYYRIGVKTRPDNTLLIQALKEILHG